MEHENNTATESETNPNIVEIITYSNIHELVRGLSQLTKSMYFQLEKSNSQWIFRGEDSSSYTLIPKVFRENGREELHELSIMKYTSSTSMHDHINELNEEIDVILRFYEIANIQGLPLPSIPGYMKNCIINNDLIVAHSIAKNIFLLNQPISEIYFQRFDFYEVVALAQHYGVPTRFLDWTYDFYVALFFSFTSTVRKILKYYNIAKGQKTEDSIKNIKNIIEDNSVIWAIDAGFLKSFLPKHPIRFLTPNYFNNPNIKSQKGLLSYCLIDNKYKIEKSIELSNKKYKSSIDDILKEYFKKTNRVILYKFMIPHTCIAECFEYVYKIGYTYSKIFPGYHSIYQEIKDQKNISLQTISKIIEFVQSF